MIEIAITKKLFGAAGDFLLDIEMIFPAGELVALYGASGSGKTSLLRMLAGVLSPTAGRLLADGETWYDSQQGINLSPQERNVGMVFQDYALFPNMTVRENIAFALKKNQPREFAAELIELMELNQLADKRPHNLSGGQRQRTALARALVRRPRLLLLDEPFAALDTEMRFRIQEYMKLVHREFRVSTILVSHDMLDVVNLATKVFMLTNGRIIRSGSPREVMPLDQLRAQFNNLQ